MLVVSPVKEIVNVTAYWVSNELFTGILEWFNFRVEHALKLSLKGNIQDSLHALRVNPVMAYGFRPQINDSIFSDAPVTGQLRT